MDQNLTLSDGRTVGFIDYGAESGAPVIWCHGGPGSRLEAASAAEAGRALGLRIVGIDRPGYGLSTPRPGRTIADWPPDAVAVADHLGLDRFFTIGMSTGGAYALALAALAAERVTGVVLGCAMTDMRHPPARASMPGPTTAGVWEAPSREAALTLATDLFGGDGAKMMGTLSGDLPDADRAALTAPAYVAAAAAAQAAMFAHGVQGYVDDRLADGPGWGSFDVGLVACPVVIVHGESDTVVPVVAARHTAALVPHAELRLHPHLGHFSVGEPAIQALAELANTVRPAPRGWRA